MRFLIPLLVLLAACGDEFTDPAEFDGEPRCGAENYYELLGKRASVLDTIDLPSTARVLRPDDVITMDFSPDRLTIDIDRSELITSVTCR
ncbi:I78 family peptidase inhibitor [Litoreibacter albidus]|uniref:Peptidase inhibitor I78 family protein n=1 Tax=Litoreibacter albidus TaxID=670155 RepID=A0A1H2WJT5_9RHOB|nr:I78 family peptidase inhibitor [Litoreibacter albidus]SDW80787.1 Peptidase inhibitor I78 family protein [Litoreibacter albidus]